MAPRKRQQGSVGSTGSSASQQKSNKNDSVKHSKEKKRNDDGDLDSWDDVFNEVWYRVGVVHKHTIERANSMRFFLAIYNTWVVIAQIVLVMYEVSWKEHSCIDQPDGIHNLCLCSKILKIYLDPWICS